MKKIYKNIFLNITILLSISTKLCTSQQSKATFTTTINNPHNYSDYSSYYSCAPNSYYDINAKHKQAIRNDYARYQNRPVFRLYQGNNPSPNRENFHVFEERLNQYHINNQPTSISNQPEIDQNQINAAPSTAKKENTPSSAQKSQQETFDACLILARQEAINDKKNGKIRDPQEVTMSIIQRKIALNLLEKDLQQIDYTYIKTYEDFNIQAEN